MRAAHDDSSEAIRARLRYRRALSAGELRVVGNCYHGRRFSLQSDTPNAQLAR